MEEEDKMRNYLDQQLEEEDKQLIVLTNDQWVVKKSWKKVKVAKEIAKGIQDELRTQMTKYDELANKHILIKMSWPKSRGQPKSG